MTLEKYDLISANYKRLFDVNLPNFIKVSANKMFDFSETIR